MINILKNRTGAKFLGFTLSEVLITIVIIGIIAAITVPIIVNQYNKEITATRLKTTYSILAQVIKQAEAQYGFIETWNTDENIKQYDNTNTPKTMEKFIKTYMLPFMRDAKYINSSIQDYGYKDGVKYPNGDTLIAKTDTTKKHIISINNGVTIFVYFSNKTVDGQKLNVSFDYLIDIDGPLRGANTFGKDFFVIRQYHINGVPLMMYYEKNIVYNQETGTFYLEEGTRTRNDYYEKCKNAGTGSFACGALIKADGWQIKKDYPWL